ncbi:MAG: acetoin utilization protein AcuC [Magnetococcales bacterium]|nr:acetoin utilization protein AcuC [Magnetococcales bacterium]
MDIPVCLYVGDNLGRYGFGDGHPFGPQRQDAFWSEAQRQGLHLRASVQEPVQANRETIELFHKPAYVEQVKRQSVTGKGYLDYGDTPAFVGVYEAASYVVGSTLAAVDGIMQGRFRRGLIPIAGLHHARPERAGGFCVFNDPGVAIMVLRQKYGLKRIAYVDIDAHHGDGVFYPFEADPDLIFADLHEDGQFLYPGTGHAHETGKDAAAGTKVNIPLPPFANDTHFFQEWPKVEALMRETRPEFIILQCGADSIDGDPITHMRYSLAPHAHATASLCQLAEELGHGRVVAVGGGGYNLRNIGQGWSAVLQAMLETPVSSP